MLKFDDIKAELEKALEEEEQAGIYIPKVKGILKNTYNCSWYESPLGLVLLIIVKDYTGHLIFSGEIAPTKEGVERVSSRCREFYGVKVKENLEQLIKERNEYSSKSSSGNWGSPIFNYLY